MSSDILPLARVASVVLGMTESERLASFLCRVISVSGFGGRRDGEAVLVCPDRGQPGKFVVVGSLLGGSADSRLLAVARSATSGGWGATTLSAPIADEEAVRAGLACGGIAEILVEPLFAVPSSFWVSVAARSHIGLLSLLPNDPDSPLLREASRCKVIGEVFRDHLLEVPLDAPLDASGEAAKAIDEQLRKGTVRAQIIESEGKRWFSEVVAPMPHIGVIGISALATAIGTQANLLGWTTTVIDERTETGLADCLALAQSLGTTDALVVLSHDLEASCGALHAAARQSLGRPYLGALGSRHTQAARAERLSAVNGWSSDDLSAIHGPVGLDIGSRTPEETALAIVAEIVAHQRNRTAQSLRSGQGPISSS
jgi:xanthine dehydrogenase accessory factor